MGYPMVSKGVGMGLGFLSVYYGEKAHEKVN